MIYGTDRILRYNPSTDTWTEVGQLTEPKSSQASTTVADISQFNDICNLTITPTTTTTTTTPTTTVTKPPATGAGGLSHS